MFSGHFSPSEVGFRGNVRGPKKNSPPGREFPTKIFVDATSLPLGSEPQSGVGFAMGGFCFEKLCNVKYSKISGQNIPDFRESVTSKVQ